MNKVIMCSMALLLSTAVSANTDIQVNTKGKTLHIGYRANIDSKNHITINNASENEKLFKIRSSLCVGGFGCEVKEYEVKINSNESYDSGNFELKRLVQPFQVGNYPIEAESQVYENGSLINKQVSKATLKAVS